MLKANFQLPRRLSTGFTTRRLVRRIVDSHLTYLDDRALRWLIENTRVVEAEAVPGCIIEAGCALGGSAIAIASAKKPERPFLVYDVFGMIPPPSVRDGDDVHRRYTEIHSGKSEGLGGETYYGYQNRLLDKVTATFHSFQLLPEQNQVRFIEGRYEDTLYPGGPVAFAHIDCDWYDSVYTCLDRIVPELAPGGRIVIDDYFHYSGCRTAVQDYLRPYMDRFEFRHVPRFTIIRR